MSGNAQAKIREGFRLHLRNRERAEGKGQGMLKHIFQAVYMSGNAQSKIQEDFRLHSRGNEMQVETRGK